MLWALCRGMTSTLAFIGLVILAAVIYLIWERVDRATERAALAVAKDIEVMGDVVASSLSPQINADVCIGSGACVAACPEKSVIGLVRGQAKLINPLGCIGQDRKSTRLNSSHSQISYAVFCLKKK